jgi:hypothetical protein
VIRRKEMGGSYKTTILGICTALVAVIGAVVGLLNGTPVDWTAVIAAVMAGIGLLKAKDSDVTGGSRS